MALFTKDNARQNAAKALAKRLLNQRLASDRLAAACQVLEAAAIAVAKLPAHAPTNDDDFRIRRLLRVREQLERVDKMLCSAMEPKAIKELSEALSRLQDQEQKLAGRPGPGTLKPRSEEEGRESRTHRPAATPMGAAPPAPASVPQANQALAPSPAPGLPSPPQALEL